MDLNELFFQLEGVDALLQAYSWAENTTCE